MAVWTQELQEEREEAVPGAGPSELAGVRPPTINHTDGLAAELISSGVLYQTAANDAPVKDTPTSLSAACRTIVYSLVEVASLQGELNAANRTSEGAQSTQVVFLCCFTVILSVPCLAQRSIGWLNPSW